MNKIFILLIAVYCLLASPKTVLAGIDGEALFNEKCTNCHALDVMKMGPSVKEMNKNALFLKSAIADGISNSGSFPMPAFGEVLKAEQIDSLVNYIISRP
ncbi:MAG: c-type cytochrome [Mariprofundus sp.]